MLKVSVSGVRGIVHKSLTPKVALEFGMAFGTLIKGAKVVVGRDTRTTGRLIRNALMCGLISSGCEIVDLGICPTPTVLLMARNLKSYGVIITASHNPGRWNGMKFAKKNGTFLNKRQMHSLHNLYRHKRFYAAVDCDDIAMVKRFDEAKDIHIDTVLKHLDVSLIKKKHFKVACDFCNGTGAVITKKFLRKLGCTVYAINDKPHGRFAHNPEPVPKHLASLSRLVKRTEADIGIAQDPDADRLALCDGNGILLAEENTLALAVKAILLRKKGSVVVNMSTSRAIDHIAEEHGVKLYRAPVGEINVTEKMRKVGALIGGEGNGGVIYPKINSCRDSLVGLGIILEYMAKTDKELRVLVSEIHQYKMLKEKFPFPTDEMESIEKRLQAKFKNETLIMEDGVKIMWTDGWAHIRASNTEPIIRVIIEADTTKKAKRLYHLVKKAIVAKE
jgi:phosphomannomutase